MEQHEVNRYMKIFNPFTALLIVQKKDSIQYITDSTRKIQVLCRQQNTSAKFLDLKLKFHKKFKSISVDIFAKATDSVTCIFPSTYFPENHIEYNVLRYV